MSAGAATAADEEDAPTGRTVPAPAGSTAPTGEPPCGDDLLTTAVTDPTDDGDGGYGGKGSRGLARAALVTAVLSVAGSVLGLVRDQAIAHLFGAGAASDAFLVSWTVPELAATVLIEDAMALLLVPAFAAALARRADRAARPSERDPVRALLAATLPRLTLLLAAVGAVLALAAPFVVDVLAPGLTDHRLAVDCTRLTAVSVFTFGLAGYLSAALRAHRRFLPPAAIYVAYNLGIIGTLLVLHERWGARAAAAGVAVGGLLMVLVQLPDFLRQLRPSATPAPIPDQPTPVSSPRPGRESWPDGEPGARAGARSRPRTGSPTWDGTGTGTPPGAWAASEDPTGTWTAPGAGTDSGPWTRNPTRHDTDTEPGTGTPTDIWAASADCPGPDDPLGPELPTSTWTAPGTGVPAGPAPEDPFRTGMPTGTWPEPGTATDSGPWSGNPTWNSTDPEPGSGTPTDIWAASVTGAQSEYPLGTEIPTDAWTPSGAGTGPEDPFAAGVPTGAGSAPGIGTRSGSGTGVPSGSRVGSGAWTRSGTRSGSGPWAKRRARGAGAGARGARHSRREAQASHLGLALVAPVIVFTVSRQAQVLIERFFAAPLPSGAISHLNYAQKVAQMPMVLSVMIVTVTFPVVSQALARGDRERARRQVQRDLTVVCVMVLLGTAFIIACAPQIIELLFQRGAFDASDTAATAAVMRVYALGLLGQSLVGALIRPYFSAARPTWYPAVAMGVGLFLTVAADAVTVRAWGAYGIAAGNAAGITVTAALLARGLAAHTIAIGARQLLTGVGRITLAAAVATAVGWGLGSLIPDPLAATAVCCIAVPVTFAAAAVAVRVPEVPHLLATAKRRLSHA